MSDRPKDSPATLGDMLRSLRWQEVTLLFTLIGSGITGYNVFVGSAKAQALDAGLPVKLEVEALKTRLGTVEQAQTQARSDMHEVQGDIRALYKALTTGERQERLEKPLPPVADAGGVP